MCYTPSTGFVVISHFAYFAQQVVALGVTTPYICGNDALVTDNLTRCLRGTNLIRLAVVTITVAALIIGAPPARSQIDVEDPPLTEEDLRTAFEQGDISEAEYSDLLESFRSRIAADSQYTDQATDIPDLPDVSEPSGGPPFRVGNRTPQTAVSYQTTIPIRGNASENHLLSIHPSFGRHSARFEITRRGDHEWQTRTARATLRHHNAALTLGAFDTRWTGGLLIGPAPDFLDRDNTFGETLLNPQRGRLHGARLQWSRSKDVTTALYSYRRDPELTHTIYGIRTEYDIASLSLQPALLHQTLTARTTGAHFVTDLLGLSVADATGPSTWQTDVASDATSFAAQGSFHTTSLDHELDLSAWHIPASFRHPLLSAHTESDREQVPYPELDRSLSSASTGERGFKARLRYGPPQTRNTIMLTSWRETSQRGASLRLRLAHERLYYSSRVYTQYYMQSRPSELSRDFRHELSARYSHRRITAQIKARYIDGTWSPFARYSAQLRVTWHSKRNDVTRGRIRIALAYDHYDLRESNAGYLTAVIVQRLRFDHDTDIDLHLRVRTAYRNNPTSITLRIVSGVIL